MTTQDAYECLQTSFAFDANFTAALPDSPQCGAFSATGNTSYCQQPVCQIYSVDMAFCGQEGLVTDQSQALLVMVCTQEVQVCLDCFTVSYAPVPTLLSLINSGSLQLCSLQLLVTAQQCDFMLYIASADTLQPCVVPCSLVYAQNV